MLYQLSYASPTHPETDPEILKLYRPGIAHGHTPTPHTERHRNQG